MPFTGTKVTGGGGGGGEDEDDDHNNNNFLGRMTKTHINTKKYVMPKSNFLFDTGKEKDINCKLAAFSKFQNVLGFYERNSDL